MSPESFITLNFSNTFKRRKMIEAIKNGRRSKEDIAFYAKCDERAVYDFFVDCQNPEHHLFLLVQVEGKQFKGKFGRQSPNKITLDPDYLKVLNWLEKQGYLCSPNRKKTKILRHFQESQNKPKLPPSTTKTSSPLKDLIKDKEKETKKEKSVWINPILDVKKLDHDAKIWAMKHASTCEISEAIDSCRYQMQQGVKISNHSAYFMGTLKNKMAQRPRR